jgi:hypothetical protein
MYEWRAVFAGVTALALAASAAAATSPPAISPAAIQAEVNFLADDLLEGRALGTRGHEIAALQVAAQFAAMGLVPAGDNGSWFQRITFSERSLDGTPTLALTGPGGMSSFVNGIDLNVGPGDATGAETISGQLVFVGFGLKDAQLGIDDYAGLDVRGKIIVVLAGSPTGMNSEIGAHLARSRPSTADALGAVGMITVRTVAADARGPWSKTVASLWRPRRVWISPNGVAEGNDSGSNLKFEAALSNTAAAKLFAGSPQSFDAVRAAAENGSPKGFDLPGTMTLTRTTRATTVTSPNILARLPGSDLAVTDQLALLSAHLDHLGIRPGTGGDRIYNGALDNASGVATLLEVARSFATDKKAPRRSLLFLVTTGEESGLQGSSYFAQHPTVAIDRIVSEVNLDMPILTCDFGDVIAYGADRSTMGPLVAAAARQQGLALSPDPQPTEALFTRSDHYSLVRAGIPSVFLKTGWHDTKGGLTCRDAEADFRKNRYHEPSDDLSQAIDWNVAAKFARVNADISRAIANARDVPRWYAGDYFGTLFAPNAPKAARPQK